MTAGMLRYVRCVSITAIGLFVARPALADSLNLAWDPNIDPVSGYAVYVGVQSGSYAQRFDVGGATAFTYTTATAGQQYCFTVAAYTSTGEGPKAGEVCGYSNRFPTLTNPGNQSSPVGQSVSLQLQGSDPEGQPVSYSATGLPAGLSLMSSTGYIAGTGTTAGSFSVTAKVSDGVLTTSQVFTWTMTTGADTTPPSISITAPLIGEGGYTSTTSSISMSGTSSDNVGVTQVTWTNSLGGSGTATGTTSWSASIPLKGGTNVITITARDAAGNTGNASRSVTYTAPVDTTPPTISIATPTSASSYTSTTASISIGGTSSDNVGVTQVTWTNSLGGSGTASGTTSWSVGSIALQGGTNVITVTARDAAGNIGTDALSVTYTPPVASTSVVLSGKLMTGNNKRKYAQLSWTTAPWESASVYRNGVKIAKTPNDGSYSDSLRYPGSYTYKVCNSTGTTCTNTVTLYY